MSKILGSVGALSMLALMAGPASAHDAYQVRLELQQRGYYSIRFLEAESPHFQINACRGRQRFLLHVNSYGRVTERNAIGPCHRHWWSWPRSSDDNRWWRGDHRYRVFGYRPY